MSGAVTYPFRVKCDGKYYAPGEPVSAKEQPEAPVEKPKGKPPKK